MSSVSPHNYETFIIKGFNDELDNPFISCVVHIEGKYERRICTHTSKDLHSCAYKLGGNCCSIEAERIWIYHNKKIPPYTSSKTTFSCGYEEAIDNYNIKIIK